MKLFSKRILNTVVLTAMIVAYFACSSLQKQATNQPEQKLNDVKYGSDERNIMDVYLPAKRGVLTPFVLLIHGGGWIGYGKEYIREYQDTLLANGIAVASINHRYANDSTVHYHEMITDAETALDYCSEHADGWHTRSNDFVVTGVSSGGHLALMTGYSSRKKIKAIVEISAPVNFADTALLNYSRQVNLLDLIQKMTGKIYSINEPPDAAFSDASPVNHIKKDIPVLIVHGDADPVVPYAQALLFNKKLEEVGAMHKLITLPDVGHNLQPRDSLLNKMMYSEAVKWILKYGCDKN